MSADSTKDPKLNVKNKKQEKLAQNLRANLLRRKQQERQRKIQNEIPEGDKK